MGIIRGLRDFFRKVYRQLRRHLSKTELIIFFSVVIAVIAAVILVIVFSKKNTGKASAVSSDSFVGKEAEGAA